MMGTLVYPEALGAARDLCVETYLRPDTVPFGYGRLIVFFVVAPAMRPYEDGRNRVA